MTHLKSALFAALLGVSAVSMGATVESGTTREQRMSDALDSYRSSAVRNPSPGPVARAEKSVKHGLKKTGRVIETGARKTGEAIHRTGEKMENKTKP